MAMTLSTLINVFVVTLLGILTLWFVAATVVGVLIFIQRNQAAQQMIQLQQQAMQAAGEGGPKRVIGFDTNRPAASATDIKES